MISHMNLADLSQLIPLAQALYKEIYQQEINPILFHNYWAQVIKEKVGGILVHHDHQEIKGFMGYTYQTNMFTSEQEVCVVFVYVFPGARGTGILGEFLQVVEGLGVRVEISLSSPSLRKAMERYGYQVENTLYGKDTR